MEIIKSFAAKTHFSELLDRVSAGERIGITRHGKLIATISPAGESDMEPVEAIIARMKKLKKGNRLNGISKRELIEEGRRY